MLVIQFRSHVYYCTVGELRTSLVANFSRLKKLNYPNLLVPVNAHFSRQLFSIYKIGGRAIETCLSISSQYSLSYLLLRGPLDATIVEIGQGKEKRNGWHSSATPVFHGPSKI